MSEYQCYEFVALERPLTAKQMAELRAISTRAEITPTRFWNEYHFGDLSAEPTTLMGRYFDAHLYYANWGEHRLMLRIPKARVPLNQLRPYFARGSTARLKLTGEHVLLDLASCIDEDDGDEQNPSSLAALSPLWNELVRGDMRPAYLAWLLAVSAGNIGDDAIEPTVPDGLAELTAAQKAMVKFLRIDRDLVTAAASASAPGTSRTKAIQNHQARVAAVTVAANALSSATADCAPFRRWLTALSVKQKDGWLRRAADEPDLALGAELLRTFRATIKVHHGGQQRTAGEIRAYAATLRAGRNKSRVARTNENRATGATTGVVSALADRKSPARTKPRQSQRKTRTKRPARTTLPSNALPTRPGKRNALAKRPR